ncbi:hypothetical protein RND81_11G146600 [Saponaria officinalis]|uniref:NAC domain-containing protein n=1 Tax=Saponaria officinalis TaxID=3572 RepID=A0AAW1HM21_SAPOF
MDENRSNFELPGFRFKPTEEELINFYLKNVIYEKKMHLEIIGFLNIYQHDPWDLPGLAKIGEREWYFFVPRDRKSSYGGKPNRTTEHGFWKATGSDRKIFSLSEPKRVIGLRKTLVFYNGRAPRGSKTDWVMNEYRLPDNCILRKDIVLCKVYRKATSLKELEQRAAKEEATLEKSTIFASCPTSPLSSSNETTSSINDDFGLLEDLLPSLHMPFNDFVKPLKEESFEDVVMSNNLNVRTSNTIQLPFERESLEELQVPKMGLDWAQDPFSLQLCSPWFENLLNFSSPTLVSQLL